MQGSIKSNHSPLTNFIDQYEEYRTLCEVLEISPHPITDFDQHQKKLLHHLGFRNVFDFLLSESRNFKITTILAK